MAVAPKHVIVTGVPGVGKTTLIQRVCETLKETGHTTAGFYTTEVRERGRRRGFDVVTFAGVTAPLARVDGKGEHRVGQYTVDLHSFETVALDSLIYKESHTIMAIDEIGKMELFSQAFKNRVTELFSDSRVTILASIPVAKGRPIPFVEQIRSRKDVKLFEVTKENRGSLQQEILDCVKNCVQRSGAVS